MITRLYKFSVSKSPELVFCPTLTPHATQHLVSGICHLQISGLFAPFPAPGPTPAHRFLKLVLTKYPSEIGNPQIGNPPA